jgi:short-subunit dehydrogenase
MNKTAARPLAVVTGASSGIGLELAWLCAEAGYDLVIAADTAPVKEVATDLGQLGASVEYVLADLSRPAGLSHLVEVIGDRPVEALLANAGHGLGGAFLDQDFSQIRHVIDTNVTGTVDLIHRIAPAMKRRGQGKILITGSIAGLMPGSFQAVYNATKAFIDSFAYGLRDELKDTGVSVTVLMPGATDTDFFARAGMTYTKVATGTKSDPADVAKAGFDAMEKNDSDVVAGWKNKIRAMLSNHYSSGVAGQSAPQDCGTSDPQLLKSW